MELEITSVNLVDLVVDLELDIPLVLEQELLVKEIVEVLEHLQMVHIMALAVAVVLVLLEQMEQVLAVVLEELEFNTVFQDPLSFMLEAVVDLHTTTVTLVLGVVALVVLEHMVLVLEMLLMIQDLVVEEETLGEVKIKEVV